ncbi:hypothetical protein [Loktanella sp. M215]|uniref:hypothetical protein n=1 Tax=Loktanella sp. M215 TaxID=2675431 RepID=UPI001F3DA7FF|nr:hypothetical protein [Loktanella sp. M215]MCF7701305.1 hypothetical protein [Loktanella sp. M215]
MSDLTLTKTRMIAGIWHGILTGATGDTAPPLTLSHKAEVLTSGLTVQPRDDGTWSVEVAVPVNRLADGVQTFVITDTATGDTLASFAFLAGEGLAEDIRAEVDLLRDELDMLKRAFRRHCVETAEEE